MDSCCSCCNLCTPNLELPTRKDARSNPRSTLGTNHLFSPSRPFHSSSFSSTSSRLLPHPFPEFLDKKARFSSSSRQHHKVIWKTDNQSQNTGPSPALHAVVVPIGPIVGRHVTTPDQRARCSPPPTSRRTTNMTLPHIYVPPITSTMLLVFRVLILIQSESTFHKFRYSPEIAPHTAPSLVSSCAPHLVPQDGHDSPCGRHDTLVYPLECHITVFNCILVVKCASQASGVSHLPRQVPL